MLIALNFSHPAAELVQRGAIEIDLWKAAPTPDHLRPIGGARAYVHLPLDAGDPDFEKTDWGWFDECLAATGTPYVNVHLNARRKDFDPVEGERERSAVRDRFLRHVGGLVERYGADRVIAENVIYRGPGGPFLEPSVLPETIGEVLERTGCGLLLDTAHARLSAAKLGMEAKAYVDALPGDRLRELHVTGILHDGTRERDSMPMGDADWGLAGHVLSRIGRGDWTSPWVVALEYGGTGEGFGWRSDPDVIASQVPRLRRLVGSSARSKAGIATTASPEPF